MRNRDPNENRSGHKIGGDHRCHDPLCGNAAGYRFHARQEKSVQRPVPVPRDTQDRFMVYVNKDDEVRFHCFGACKGDWDIYDLIMLRMKYPFRRAQQVWAAHLGVADFKFNDVSSPHIPEPDETPEPDEPVGFVEPKN
jgi:DNA primase